MESFQVSVLVITYNQANYLSEALRSVINQITNFKFEIIIADDASLDNTEEIVNKIVGENINSRCVIKYYKHKENIGAYLNSKFGFKKCMGKYLAICEGDDYWIDRNKLQYQYDFLERNKSYSITMSAVNILLGDSVISAKENHYLNKIGYSHESYYRYQFSQTSSFFFRNVIDLPDWFKDIYAGDFALVALTSIYGCLHYDKEVRSVYRFNTAGGISDANRKKKLQLYRRQIYLNKILINVEGIKFKKALSTTLIEILINKIKFKVLSYLYRKLY